MKFQTMQRILCCFLAMLILCFAVVKPLEARAVAAVAGLAYVSVEAAIPWILSALSVVWATSALQDIITSKATDQLQDDIIILDDSAYIPAYNYGSQYYIESDIVSKVASLATEVKNNDVTSSSGTYDYVHTFSYTDGSGLREWVIWCNEVPKESVSPSSNETILKIPMPCVVSFSSSTESYTKDFSDEPSASWNYYQISFLNTPSVTYNGLTTQKLVSEEESVNVLATTGIWIVDTTGGDNNKKHYYPVIKSKDVNTEDVQTTELSGEIESSSNPNDVSFEDFTGFLNDFWTGFKTKMLEIPDILREIKELVKNIPDILREIKEFVKNIPDILREIKELVKNFPDTLSQIWEWLLTLPQTIYNHLVDAIEYVFVPSEGYLDTKVMELRASFPLFDSVLTSAKTLRSLFNFGSTPPIIYIDLGASTSWNIGSKVVFIDMTWYAKYKPTVDVILSVFLWLFFLWRVFLSLPGIISGTSGIWGRGSVEPTKTSDSTDIMIIR